MSQHQLSRLHPVTRIYQSVKDAEDAEPELQSDIQLHQDELSELHDNVTSDSEPVLSKIILAYPTL